MTDNPRIVGPQDQHRINIHEDYEVRYWTRALGVTEARLKELVHLHGDSAREIRRVLHIPDRQRVASNPLIGRGRVARHAGSPRAIKKPAA